MVTELSRLEAIELDLADKLRSVDKRLGELIESRKEYQQAIEEVKGTI